MFGWLKKLFTKKKSPPKPDWLDREFSTYAPPVERRIHVSPVQPKIPLTKPELQAYAARATIEASKAPKPVGPANTIIKTRDFRKPSKVTSSTSYEDNTLRDIIIIEALVDSFKSADDGPSPSISPGGGGSGGAGASGSWDSGSSSSSSYSDSSSDSSSSCSSSD